MRASKAMTYAHKRFADGVVVNGDCVDVMKHLKSKMFSIAICDAPYNIGIAKWDKIDNFYQWSQRWISLCVKKLASNGSLFLWGQAYRNLDYMRLIIFCAHELQMQIVNEIIWCKNIGLTATKDRFVRSHETCFWLSKSIAHTYNLQRIFTSEISYGRFKEADRDRDGVIRVKDLKVAKELYAYNQRIARGAKNNDIFLDITKPSKLCRDWWDDISTLHEKGKRGAKRQNVTAKNIMLATRIILAATNEGDKVLIPFGGTGSEALACVKNGRSFLVIEKDPIAYAGINKTLADYYNA